MSQESCLEHQLWDIKSLGNITSLPFCLLSNQKSQSGCVHRVRDWVLIPELNNLVRELFHEKGSEDAKSKFGKQNTFDNTSFLPQFEKCSLKRRLFSCTLQWHYSWNLIRKILGNQSEQSKDTGRCQKIQTPNLVRPTISVLCSNPCLSPCGGPNIF